MATTHLPTSRSAFWGTWTATVAAAELLGFCVPLIVGALTADTTPVVAVPALLVAGAVEGAALGAGQAVVLVRRLPDLPVRAWVGATAAAAVLCYVLGLLPSVTEPVRSGGPGAVTIVAAVLGGLVLLAAIGTAQWFVLRRLVPRAAWWIPATALAWLLGLAAFVAITTPWWEPGQSVLTVIGIGLVGAVVMALVVAAVTGWAMAGLLTAASTRQGRHDG